MIHLYCGDGKGKTTAAMGLALRMAGRGKPVVIAQFLKGADSGERYALSLLPKVTLLPAPEQIKFSFQLTPEEREEVNAALVRLRSSGEVACRYYQGDISDEELAEDYNGELAYQDDDLYDLVCDAIALFYRANPNPIPYERRRGGRR